MLMRMGSGQGRLVGLHLSLSHGRAALGTPSSTTHRGPWPTFLKPQVCQL